MDRLSEISILDGLLTKAYSAEKGYREAAKQVNDVNLRDHLEFLANNRLRFLERIQSQIRLLGGVVEPGDSLAAKVHRTWISLRTAFSTNNEASVLDEVIRGEETTLSEYEQALIHLDGHEHSYRMVQDQRAQVAKTLGKIKMIETVFSA